MEMLLEFGLGLDWSRAAFRIDFPLPNKPAISVKSGTLGLGSFLCQIFFLLYDCVRFP